VSQTQGLPKMLGSLSVKSKLRFGFGIVLLLLCVIAGAALWGMRDMARAARGLGTDTIPGLIAASNLAETFNTMRRNDLVLVAATDAAMVQAARQAQLGVEGRLEAALRAYRLVASGGEETRAVEALSGALRTYVAEHRRLVEATTRNDEGAQQRFLAETRDDARNIAAILREMQELNERDAAAETARADSVASFSLTVISLLALVALIGGGAFAWLLSSSLARRVGNLSVALNRLSKRDYDFELKEAADGDEIGAMALALDTCRDGLKEADRMAASQIEEAKKQADRATRVAALVQGFEAEASGVLRAVSSAATELSATASVMTETAEDGTRQATAVASAAEQASTNVQTVAASTEELATSIAEVARQVRDTASITNRAAEAARETDETVRSLADAASKIGDVVRLISDIAGQTNLLALNATIEAARAGDAGKGFAVVASEVKGLASQTAKATEEIGQQISAMQAETARTVDAIAGIGRTIEELNTTTAQVAAASEQQAAATQEIGRAVAEAAQGTQEASRSALGVREGAERTGGAAQDLKGASGELAQQSERLRGQVDIFLANIRAA
jgi:methyl-accepting chemotaxis protein